MLRRSHKKSKHGCLECKGRHIKCDEGQPKCKLCTVSGRECSYAIRAAPTESGSILVVPSDEPSLDLQQDHSPKPNPLLGTSSATALPDRSPASSLEPPWCTSINGNGNLPESTECINFGHMELLIHAIVDRDMFSLGGGNGGLDYRSQLSAGLGAGLKSPYLLYQFLAFSARHLAFIHPERSASYMHQAVTLQTRAISLFNSAWTRVDQSNCVAVLLFSTVLGHHLLVDTLARRDYGSLDTFLTHYVQCVEMHRGIHTIALDAWPLLMESELKPILSASAAFTSQAPKGDDCQRIVELVESTEALEISDKAACLAVIRHLQVGFDALCTELDFEKAESRGTRYQMISSWALLAPPKFTALLAAKRPEALAILAYYSVLLHHGRHMWQVRDAGPYILDIIGGHLGTDWDYWLEHPRQVMVRDLEPTT